MHTGKDGFTITGSLNSTLHAIEVEVVLFGSQPHFLMEELEIDHGDHAGAIIYVPK